MALSDGLKNLQVIALIPGGKLIQNMLHEPATKISSISE